MAEQITDLIRDVTDACAREIEASKSPETEMNETEIEIGPRSRRPPAKLDEYVWNDEKERALRQFTRKEKTLKDQLQIAHSENGSRRELKETVAKIEHSIAELERANERLEVCLKGEELNQHLKRLEQTISCASSCVQTVNLKIQQRADEESVMTRSTNFSKVSETTKRARLAKLKLDQAKKEAEQRANEEREEFRRREEERRVDDKRRIRELEYQAEQRNLEAQLEAEQDPDSLESRLRDFDVEPDARNHIHVESRDSKLPGATTDQSPTSSWVSQFCQEPEPRMPERAVNNDRHITSSFASSVPRLELPRFSGDPLEWPHFIALFKSLVHDQPFSDTQRMTYLQRTLEGDAKRAVGGMLNHGHLYKAALCELEEQFGNEETVAGAYLKTISDHPKVKDDDFTQLRSFSNTLHVAVTTLQSLEYVHDLAASDNLRRVVNKLPLNLKERWGEKRMDMLPKTPTLLDFDQWLRARVRAKASVTDQLLREPKGPTPRLERKFGSQRQSGSDGRKDVTEISTLATGIQERPLATAPKTENHKEKGPACYICEQTHGIEKCPTFKALTVDQRAQTAKDKKLCFKCLRSTDHIARKCDSKESCMIENCNKNHHTLIHGAAPVFVGAASIKSERTTVLLQIVPLVVETPQGNSVKTFALLDSGSQATLILEDFANQIGLDGQSTILHIGTVSSKDKAHNATKVSFTVSAVDDRGSATHIPVDEAWTVPHLNLPSQKVTHSMMQSWPHLADIEVPEVDSRDVTMLLGANVVDAIAQYEVRRGAPGQPAAVLTAFGWTLTGSMKSFVPTERLHCMFVHQVPSTDDLLHRQVQNWWRTDTFGCKYQEESPRSHQDKKALEILDETVHHNGERYEVGLLWKEPVIQMPNNRVMAEKRLKSTEKTLNRDQTLAKKYCETIDGYVAKGHARKLSPEEAVIPNPKQWFLPHHPVLNPNKPGKVRIVMDAAAKSDGVSLNDKLLIGPDLLNSLIGVLLRFREERVAIGADVEAMFHQCLVIENDQPALRFLWRGLDRDRPPDVYQMLVMIFGAASSPCTANYVLRKTADDNRNNPSFSSDSIEAVERNFYMDDLLKSVPDEDSAVRLQKELTTLLAKGGFHLTKWSSSSREVLSQIPNQEKATPSIDLDLDKLPVERSLGLKWNTETDCFRFSAGICNPARTKRGVLSQVSSVFDPLGVLAPFLLPAKCLIQTLWRKKKDWEDPLDEEDRMVWENWLEDLSNLQDFEIPRCLCVDIQHATQIQLHVFGDASEQGFGAVCYLRYVLLDGRIHVSFVLAKTRVAPLRQLSIPRLELQAATLGVRLANTVKRELTLNIADTVFWSDSKTVLLYIANESRRFHTFVANRVSEIQDSSSAAQWRHVPGRLNPADDGTRGLRASDLDSQCRWIKGPPFLWQPEDSWPQNESAEFTTDDTELKSSWSGLVANVEQSLPDPAKFSSWTRYRRVIAWMYRFVSNAKSTAGNRISSPLTAEELCHVEKIALKQAQTESFSQDIEALIAGRSLPHRSQLHALCPYVDEDGLLRVGGRLRKAPIPEAARHQIILDPAHDVTRLVLTHYHLRLYCAGNEHVQNELRQQYWILRGLRAVRKVSASCGFCRRRKAQPQPPVMADLPNARLGYMLPPFTNTGVDYFGPLYVKCRRSTVKRYGVLFTCLTVRAVHIEIAHSLEADAFIMALRRMMARRGRPAHIWSDNGTNFVGADRELTEALEEWNQEHIADQLSQDRVQWHFNPPASPHFGGAWERLVQSAKRALKSIAGNQCVSDETLLTFMAEVESLLNSRPLTHVSSDPCDDEALTPNHFLLGRASLNIPLGVVTDRDLYSRKHWKHAQVMANHFWKRWLREYIPTLTTRNKWNRDKRNIAEGDLVLVADNNSPRGRWPLGRVSRVIPSDDGKVRAAHVQTKAGTYVRPVAKLCLLEGNNEST